MTTIAYKNTQLPEFGGTLSVRRPENSRPLIIFGQDESVFSQFSFNGTQWVGLSGKRSILPKNDGIGVMISAFQSREFRWGVDITVEQMVRINKQDRVKSTLTLLLPMKSMAPHSNQHLPRHP